MSTPMATALEEAADGSSGSFDKALGSSNGCPAENTNVAQ